MESKVKTLTVLIPCYNEKATVFQVLENLTSVKFPNDWNVGFTLVDDCSSDGSLKEVLKFKSAFPAIPLTVIAQEQNLGKGAAIRKGVKHSSSQYIIAQDADHELDPSEIPSLLKMASPDAVVFGSRFLDTTQTVRNLNFTANKFLTWLFNRLNGTKITDMETCYKLIPRDAFEKCDLKENRFGFEPEIAIKLNKQGLEFKEVKISYKPRSVQEGKKIGFVDGVRAVHCIFRYSLLGGRSGLSLSC